MFNHVSPGSREYQELQLDQMMFSSQKKAPGFSEDEEDMLNMSSQHSPSIREIQGSNITTREDQPHRYSRVSRHNWRQMLTPHQMNDITTTLAEYQSNHNISRPCQSPDLRAILGTENSIKLGTDTTQQFKTQDFSDKALEMQTFSTVDKKEANESQSQKMLSGGSSQRNMMSMNSNLKSMLNTIKDNELNFFKDLEQKYFKLAIKKDSSSPSIDKNNNDYVEEQLENISQNESVSSVQNSQVFQHYKEKDLPLEDHFANFRQNLQQTQRYRASDLGHKSQKINSFNPGNSQMLSDFSLSPQKFQRDESSDFLQQSSPQVTSQNYLHVDQMAKEDLKESLQLFKLRLETIQRQQEEKERRISDIHSPIAGGYSESNDDYQSSESDNEILNTYRINCQMAKQKFHQTFQNTLGSKNSTLRHESQHLIILNKSEASSNNTPDVYQTAKWNNTASIADSFQETMKMKQLSNESDISSQKRNLLSQSKEDEQLLSTKQTINNHNIYLYEENHELKSYLRKAYQCVLKFLNSQDRSQINPDLANDLQVFAELEQERKEWLSPNTSSQLMPSERSRQQQTPEQPIYDIQEVGNDTQCTSIESNLSGIKANLKETKKSLIQAKKLLFQEKCINIDHEKQIQELKSQMNDIQHQIKLIESHSINVSKAQYNYHQSPDQKQMNFLSRLKSPNTAIQTTQCSNCCSKNHLLSQVSPIMMGTLSSNTVKKGNSQTSQVKKYDSFITDDESLENPTSPKAQQQKEEYSFLQDEAEQLKSSNSQQQSTKRGYQYSSHDETNRVSSLESMNDKLKNQLELNNQAFVSVQQELDQKDYIIQRLKFQDQQRQQKIQSLEQQLAQNHQSLQSLLDNQKDSEDIFLEQIQKYNAAEEELMIMKQHLTSCKTQLDYFKSKYESFSQQNSQNYENQYQQQLQQKSLKVENENQQNRHFQSLDTEKRSDQQAYQKINSNQFQSTQKYNKPIAGTICHKKKNTANFNSISNFENEDCYIECDSNSQSERVQKFHEMREKLTKQFGGIGSLLQDDERSEDFNYLRNGDQSLANSRIEMNSQMRVLSATDLELFNSITHQKSSNYSSNERYLDQQIYYRKSPTFIIHDEQDGSLRNIDGKLQNSSILKYSGDTFV